MSLVKWNQRGDLTAWTALRDLEARFSSIFGEMGSPFGGFAADWAPAIDLREEDNAYILEADVPGMKKEDIYLEVIDNVVTIKGERKAENETRQEGYHHIERRYGSFQRSMEIPGGFKADAVEAKFQDGVLRVKLPKLETALPKQIKVSAN